MLGRYASDNCAWGTAVVQFTERHPELESEICVVFQKVVAAFILADHQTSIMDHEQETQKRKEYMRQAFTNFFQGKKRQYNYALEAQALNAKSKVYFLLLL